MGVRADVRDEVRKETVTKIHGQPTNKDLTILEKELIAILANIPTTLGGGNHGHAGILMDPARYLLTAGVPFVNPANPGNYPAGVAGNAAAGARARAEAQHKEEVKEYETFQGVTQATKDIIMEAVDHEYLLEIEDEILGFLNETPISIMNHLRNRGGTLDFADTKTLLAERDGEWDASEVPQIYFNRVEKAIQGLTRAGINSDLNERRDMALFYLKATGEFDAAVRDLYSPIRVRTLILRVLFSFSWNFRLCVRTCCHIIATSPQTICHHHRRIPLPFNHHHQPPYMTSYLRSIAPQTSIATIEFICPSWLKRHPPLSLCLRHSLL